MKKKTDRVLCYCSNVDADIEPFNWTMKDVQKRMVKPESFEGTQFMDSVSLTNFDSKFQDRYWRIENIHLIQNNKLYRQYEEFRKELSALGRTAESIQDTLLFSVETEKSCKDICQDGYKVGSKRRHVLGHTGSGVHLVQHYDILTRYLTFQQYSSPTYVLVFKAFLGKQKPIVPRLHRDDNYVSPNAGFDSHVSARQVDKRMSICEALNCSYVYLYEFDDVASNPVKYPRQILPCAILQLVKKKVPIMNESPFLAVGPSDFTSNWEVKGETRRGFRFMFSKSGLKGRHKVFAKDIPSAPIGSYLKGQILEMRTKPSKKTAVETPPTLQKIDDVDDVNSHGNACETKPPSLQKVHTNEPISSTPDHSIPVPITKPLDPSILNTVNFPYMHVYPQLSLKALVKLKRLKQSKGTIYTTSLSHSASVERNSEYEEADKNKTNNDIDTTSNKSEVLRMLQSENIIGVKYTNKMKDCDEIKAKPRCETSAMCSTFHTLNETKRQNGVKTNGKNTKLLKKKNIFKPCGTKRRYKVKQSETAKNKYFTEKYCKVKKCSQQKNSTEQVAVQEYAVEVNGETHADSTCSSIKVKFTRKSVDDVCTSKDMSNTQLVVSTSRSETLVAEQEEKRIEEKNSDVSYKSANANVYQSSLSTYFPHSMSDQSSHLCAAQTSSINSNQVIIEKSKSPVVANAAPDILNLTPKLASAQIFTCNNNVGNRCESTEASVENCDNISFEMNESNLVNKRHIPISQSLKTKTNEPLLKTSTETDKEHPVVTKHPSTVRKISTMLPSLPRKPNAISSRSCDISSNTGGRETSLERSSDKRVNISNVLAKTYIVSSTEKVFINELQKPQTDDESSPFFHPTVSCQPEDLCSDKLVDVHKIKQALVSQVNENHPDDKIKLLQAYSEVMISSQPNVPPNSNSCATNGLNSSSGKTMVNIVNSKSDKQSHSSTKHVKVPTAFSNECVTNGDTTTTASKPSFESGKHSNIEYNTKITNSVESGRVCSVPKEDEIKTILKVDTLTASRLRSFLGSTAAAAMKQRKSFSDKKTASNCNKNDRSLESYNRSVPEIHKDKTFLSPQLLIGTDSTDDNDSQDTVIGGLSLSPIRRFTPEPLSLHELHNNVRIDDFDNLFTPSTYRKEMSESCAPVVKIERDETDVSNETPLCPESVIDSAIVSTSTADERIPTQDSCSIKSVKEEVREPNTGCNSSLPENTCDIPTTQSALKPPPALLPRTQRELAKGVSMLNASQTKTAIVDTLKELSNVLKYLTENSGKSKRDAAFVAEKMCRTLSSVPSKKQNVSSCSEVSSSVQDEMLITQPAVKIKQEPQDEHEYLSAIPQTPAIDENAQLSANYESVFTRIKTELPEKSAQTKMISDVHTDVQQPSSENIYTTTVDTTSSKQKVNRYVTADKNSKLNEVWNECVFHDDGDLEQPPHIPCTNASDRLHYLPDPSKEPDILLFETFGNVLERSFTTRNLIKMKQLPLNSPVESARKESNCVTSLQKPKPSSLTIKSGVLNKGLKFNSLRRKRQTKTLTIKQFPSIPPLSDNDTISECQAVTIKTENTTNPEMLHSEQSLGLAETTDGVNQAQVYLTVCQKLDQLKEYRNGGNNEQPRSAQDQEPIIASSVSDLLYNAPIANLDDVSSSDNKAPNEQINVNQVRSDSEHSHEAIRKENDKRQNADEGKVKKKAHDVIPFHTVIRLKKLQYMRYKRGESQKKFIDYRDVFSKLSYRNRNYRNFRSRTTTSKSPEEKSLMSDVKTEPLKQQENEPVKNNDNLGKKLNYFIPKFKNSAISKRGTALIEDKFRDPTVQVGSLTSNTAKTHISPEKEELVHSSDISTKEWRSQSHKSDSIEQRNYSNSHPHRSRSKSSHRSHTSDQSRKRKSTRSPMVVDRKRKLFNNHYEYRYVGTHTSQPHDRTGTNTSRFTRNKPLYKSAPYFAKSSFSRSGTGYFSWRRKYQPNPIRRNTQEDVIVTATGKVLSKSEYIEWTKFKQREDLRMQIESAIKEYRKTFEFTADDQRGDQKVASYLHLLTDKLDEIQSKRDKVEHTSVKSETIEKMKNTSPEKDTDTQHPKRRAKYLIDKLERSKSFNSNVAHSSISKLSNSLASDSNKFSYKQRQYVEGIEVILKQHLEKHCDYITKQIKQEITDEIEELQSNDNVDKDKLKYKTKKPYRDSEYKGNYKTHHKDKRNGVDRHCSSRSRERDETCSRYSSEKRGGHDVNYERGRRDRHREPIPNGAHFYKDKYDISTKYGATCKYENKKKDDIVSYKKDMYKRRHIHRPDKCDEFDEYDFQQNYDRYQNKDDYKKKEFRPYKHKPWFQGKYVKSNWYHHEEKHHSCKSDRDYDSRFKNGKHLVDNDEFNAARYSKPPFVPFRGRGRGRGFFRGRPSYHKRYEPAKYSSKGYLDTNYQKSSETKRDVSKGYNNKSGSRPNSSSNYKGTVNTEIIIEGNTDEDGPKPIPIVCSRRS